MGNRQTENFCPKYFPNPTGPQQKKKSYAVLKAPYVTGVVKILPKISENPTSPFDGSFDMRE